MAQAVLLSLVAGIASALLSGVLTPGSMLAALLFFIAPLPLMIVGLGWHPLLAALGALFACILMSFGLDSMAALNYAGMVGLPSWLACEGVIRLMVGRPRDESVRAFGLRLGTGLLGGISLYTMAATLVYALKFDLDYVRFQRRLTKAVGELFLKILEGERGPLPSGIDVSGLAAIYASIVPVIMTFLVCLMLTLSLYVAVKVVHKSERLPFTPPPLFLAALPKEALFVMVGCVALTRAPGWLGFIGSSGVAALTFCFVMTGLAVMHAKTLGRTDRPLMLGVAWITLLVFGLPAIVFAFVGALDAAFDFRRLSGGPSKPPNT